MKMRVAVLLPAVLLALGLLFLAACGTPDYLPPGVSLKGYTPPRQDPGTRRLIKRIMDIQDEVLDTLLEVRGPRSAEEAAGRITALTRELSALQADAECCAPDDEAERLIREGSEKMDSKLKADPVAMESLKSLKNNKEATDLLDPAMKGWVKATEKLIDTITERCRPSPTETSKLPSVERTSQPK